MFMWRSEPGSCSFTRLVSQGPPTDPMTAPSAANEHNESGSPGEPLAGLRAAIAGTVAELADGDGAAPVEPTLERPKRAEFGRAPLARGSKAG